MVITCRESREFLSDMGICREIIATPSHSEDSISLILDNGNCIVGDLEPISYLDAYEDFFEQPVTERDDIYSVFTINGFRFGLFAYKIVNEKHNFGSNCLPSISVNSLDILNAKINGKEICFPLTKIGKNWVVEFVGSEGNHVEMTAPVITRETL